MSDKLLLLVGSANGPLPYIGQSRGAGLSCYAFDGATGATQLLARCGEVLNPTFVSPSPDGRLLVAVTERGDWAFGSVTTLTLDHATGAMRTVAAASSMGATPAHVTFAPDGRAVAVANYSAAPVGESAGASLTVHRVNADGSFGQMLGTATQQGSGPNAGRQERSHAHCARWSHDGRFVFVADLGTDELVSFAVTATGLQKAAVLKTPAGAGPRHLALHPDGVHAYLVCELDSTVLSLTLDAAGQFSLIGRSTTLPEGVTESTCSAVQVTRDGRHVLAGNRGHDSIAVLKIDDAGVARFVTTVPSDGHIPRDMQIDPSGRFVAVSNQESNHVSLFRLDGDRLTLAGRIDTGSPTCVSFVARA